MPPTPSRPTRRHAPPGPPRPAAPHDPEAPSDSYSTALTWTPSFPTDEVSGNPGVVQPTARQPYRSTSSRGHLETRITIGHKFHSPWNFVGFELWVDGGHFGRR